MRVILVVTLFCEITKSCLPTAIQFHGDFATGILCGIRHCEADCRLNYYSQYFQLCSITSSISILYPGWTKGNREHVEVKSGQPNLLNDRSSFHTNIEKTQCI